MGLSESKNKLGQIVVIYGYRSKEISWKNFDNRSVYRTSGLIVEHNNHKFVITTRTKLISCETIVMYHSYFDGNEPVMCQELSIIFQSIKCNIIVLSSKGKNELDLSFSQIIHGEFEPQLVCPTCKIYDNNNIIPTKRSQYFIAAMNMDINSNIIKYTTKIIKVKYVNHEIYEQAYIPEKYMFIFKCLNQTSPESTSNLSNTPDPILQSYSDLTGICGSVVFDIRHRVVGIVIMTDNQKIFVLPIKHLKKIFNEFYNFRNIPKLYHASSMLPFLCEVDKKNKIIITSDSIVNSTNGKIILKKNDIVTHINLCPIKFIVDQHTVFDEDYQQYIPVNAYLEMILSPTHPTKIAFQRKKHNSSQISVFSLDIYPVENKIEIPLTNQPNYNPKDLIPYLIIRDLVIVQLTHELMDIMTFHNIIMKNKLFEQIIENKHEKNNKIFIIIDCTNNILAKKYNLPQILTFDNKQIIECPVIMTINSKIVKSFDKINKIIKENNIISLRIKLNQNQIEELFL